MITNAIGTNAGNIWKLLDESKELSTKQIKVKLNITEKDLYLALGWLARETKLSFFENGKEMMVALIY